MELPKQHGSIHVADIDGKHCVLRLFFHQSSHRSKKNRFGPSGAPPDRSHILHLHVDYSGFPRDFSFIIFFQFTGFVYNIHLILKETEDQLSKERSKIWYNYNYYSWVLFRFILMGIFTTIALYFEFTQWRFSISQRIFVLSGFVILYSFGIFWLYKIIQVRRKKAREATLAV